MEIDLIRKTKTDKTTIGDLSVNGKFFCFVLEDKDRGLKQSMTLAQIKKLKVYGETAIPEGRYEIVITMSDRFKRRLPLLMNVPGYEGIRIHTGNKAVDTHGCLLPGRVKSVDAVAESTIAFNSLFALLDKTLLTEKVFINVKSA